MFSYFNNHIEFVNIPGKGPGLIEHAPHTIQINATSTASIERYNDVRIRCHIVAAAYYLDCDPSPLFASFIYLDFEYATFHANHASLNGMTVAALQRRGEIPFVPIYRKSTRKRYCIVPELIDFEPYNSLRTPEKS